MSIPIVDKVFDNHFLRKCYHLLGGGFLILALGILDQSLFLIVAVLYIAAFYIFGRRISFAASGIVLLLILSHSKWITIGASLIWLIGDGMAGLIGQRYGRLKWPWNPQKSILGSFSFFVTSYLAIWIWLAMSAVQPSMVLSFLSLIPCLAASIVEMLPITFIRDRKPDDNLIVLLITGLILKIITYGIPFEAAP
jgi:dolichol kinase